MAGSRRRGGAVLFAALVMAMIAAFLFLGGCAGSRAKPVQTVFVPFTPEEQELQAAATHARYRLRVGDIFRVDFKYQEELSTLGLVILPDGRFSMPGLEDMRAAGLTVAQLDSAITAHFRQDYLNPDLTVIVQELGSWKVFVLGEVYRPGMYDLPPGGAGLMQAIALAGGAREEAEVSQTLLVRLTPEGYMYRVCDLSHLEKRGVTDLSYFDVRPYDVIYVPRSAISDLAFFSKTVLRSLVDVSQLFFSVWAISHIDQIRIMR